MKLKEQNILLFPRTMGIGGTEKVVLQLCEILKPLVNNLVVCSCGGSNVDVLRKMRVKHYEIADIESKSLMTVISVSKRLLHIIKEENITLIHTHHRMAAFYVALLGLSNKLLFLNTCHNTFTNKRLLTRLAYKNANLIACGEMVKKNLVEYFGLPDKQITVIHNAVKPFDGRGNPIEALQNKREKGKILIGNVGRLSEQKGMEYFLEAAAITARMHSEAYFVIVGDGELGEQLKEKAKRLNIQDKVLFLGYRNDIQNVMSQLDFVVLSSLWEGLPLTPIEAFSVGKAVIGTDVDGTPEIIRDGVDGYLIEPRNSIQLAEKMNALIEYPAVRNKMEKQSKKRYQDEFSFGKLKQRYLDLYEVL